MMEKAALQEALCKQLCADVRIIERDDGKVMIDTPFEHPDGDRYSLYLREMAGDRFRVSDGADTLMRLSYDTPDVGKYFKGSKGEFLKQILRENRVEEKGGEFFAEMPSGQMSGGIFRLCQALNKIYDLSYLDRDHDRSTFYRDLAELIKEITRDTDIKVTPNYQPEGLRDAEDYTIDYSLETKDKPPLFLFGAPSNDKVQLVTITLQHLIIHQYPMRPLVVFENQEDISRRRLSRLTNANVGGFQVSSIASKEPLAKNIGMHLNGGMH